MNTIKTDIDDKCQHPDGCMKSYFTYCPHCRLFVCINHLNQHHDVMKNDVIRTFNKVENQRIYLKEQIDRIKQQQIILNNFYDMKIKNLNNRHQIASNICDNLSKDGSCYLLTAEYNRSIKEFESLKQEQDKRTCIQAFLNQIDQILEKENRTIDTNSNDEIPLLTFLDNEPTINILSQSSSPGEESNVEVIMDCDVDESLDDNGNETDSTTSSLKSKMSIKLAHSACPLTAKNAFGLSIDLNIHNIPCNFKSKTGRLTFGQYLNHLISSHRMRQRPAKIILETLLSNKNKNFDVTTLDLFSNWTSGQILTQPISLFVGNCPIKEPSAYGLPVQHNAMKCLSRRPVRLYQHLRLSHGLNVDCARRLINAIINSEPTTKEIFKPNEIIFENYINRPKT